VTALDRIAGEIGLALGDCGGTEDSPLVDEIAAVLVELAEKPTPRGRRRKFPFPIPTRLKIGSPKSIPEPNDP
jgi:hypothetical protein